MPLDRLLHPRLGHSAKVCALTDLEFRVWVQCQLSADDFGVLRATAITVQATNDRLAERPAKVIQAAIDRLVSVGLFVTFEHQGYQFLCQRDWQDYQRVEYPRTTHNPAPSEDVLQTCSEKTRSLFQRHPGGFGKRSPNVPQTLAEDSPTVPQTFDEHLEQSRARETANGKRLTANGSSERPEAPPPSRGKPLAYKARIDVAWPGRPPVPSGLHAEFIDRLAGDPEDARARLFAWYPEASAPYEDQPIGDDDFAFWRARFREWVGTTRTAPTTTARPAPTYAAPWCDHDPRCASIETHQLVLARESGVSA